MLDRYERHDRIKADELSRLERGCRRGKWGGMPRAARRCASPASYSLIRRWKTFLRELIVQ